MFSQLRPAIVIFLALTVVTGVVYPLAVTGFAQVLFPKQANGSLLVVDGKTVGSELLGQPMEDPAFFWPRPSATSPTPCNGTASSGSNLGPTNPALIEAVTARVAALRGASEGDAAPVPIDLVTASGSGLDPHITPAAAAFQVPRIAKLRKLDPEVLAKWVAECTESRTFELLGEPRVNVLRLNLRLQSLSAEKLVSQP